MQRALAAAEGRLKELDSSRASLEAQLRAAQLQTSSAIQACSPVPGKSLVPCMFSAACCADLTSSARYPV